MAAREWLGWLLLVAVWATPAVADTPASGVARTAQSTQGHPFLVDLLSQAPAHFALKCGNGFCDGRVSYCETVKTDVPELPNDYACRTLPPACRPGAALTAPDCSCFAQHTRCGFCSVSPEAGFYRTCIGGG